MTATAAELEGAIENAIKAKDIPGVGILLTQLAFVDPNRAQVIWDTLRLGVEMAQLHADKASRVEEGL